MKTRDQLLQEFCAAANDRERLVKLMSDALDTLQFVEAARALTDGRLKKANEQIARQAKVIDGLNQALSGPTRK